MLIMFSFFSLRSTIGRSTSTRMDQTTEARKYGSPKGWNDLFPSCPGIAKKLLMYLDLETAVACRKVYPEWEAVIDSCKVIQERFSKSSLFQAAKDGHVYTAELLISKGADVDSTEGGGATDQPLKIAAENGHVGMVELLIGKGADVNISDPLGDTTLTVSSKRDTSMWLRGCLLMEGMSTGPTDMERLP